MWYQKQRSDDQGRWRRQWYTVYCAALGCPLSGRDTRARWTVSQRAGQGRAVQTARATHGEKENSKRSYSVGNTAQLYHRVNHIMRKHSTIRSITLIVEQIERSITLIDEKYWTIKTASKQRMLWRVNTNQRVIYSIFHRHSLQDQLSCDLRHLPLALPEGPAIVWSTPPSIGTLCRTGYRVIYATFHRHSLQDRLPCDLRHLPPVLPAGPTTVWSRPPSTALPAGLTTVLTIGKALPDTRALSPSPPSSPPPY